ncbi:MAG: multidrug transporter [Deltaproteobacteria bacterium]|nr:MAG: multidrug transporter [Deltaproteobacteria bacterium]
MKNLLAITVAALFMLAGCTMIPEYTRPKMPVAGSFENSRIKRPAADKIDLSTKNAGEIGWREVFIDPDLQSLIQTALENNKNLRQAALELAMYHAKYRIQKSVLYPGISASGFAMKQRTLGGESHVTSEVYSLEVGTASWELDFFGRIRSLKEQTLETALAKEESLKSVQVSLVSEVAAAYLTLIADRELLRISKETKKIEEESYELVRQRVEAGVADQMDLAQARTALESVKVNLPMYRRQAAQDINRLELLTGSPLPENLLGGGKRLTELAPLAVLPSAMSSEILLQRPDIQAAEHQLKAANANIGAARAAFFPSISLTAGIGLISSELSELFDDSGTYQVRPAITLPIFNAGRLKAELDVAKLQKEASIVQYEYAIQNAFREVSDALAALETYDEQLASQKANLDANQQYYDHAKNRYEEGVDSFLTLLIAQRSLYAAKQSYLVIKLSNYINKVNLYKVLGGGWVKNGPQSE